MEQFDLQAAFGCSAIKCTLATDQVMKSLCKSVLKLRWILSLILKKTSLKEVVHIHYNIKQYYINVSTHRTGIQKRCQCQGCTRQIMPLYFADQVFVLYGWPGVCPPFSLLSFPLVVNECSSLSSNVKKTTARKNRPISEKVQINLTGKPTQHHLESINEEHRRYNKFHLKSIFSPAYYMNRAIARQTLNKTNLAFRNWQMSLVIV